MRRPTFHLRGRRAWRWGLLIALVALALTAGITSAGWQVWTEVIVSPDPCHAQGLVCAEIVDEHLILVCCVEPGSIGTSNGTCMQTIRAIHVEKPERPNVP